MKSKIVFLLFTSILMLSSCGSIKSTIQNIDNSAIKPTIKNKQFLLTEYDKEGKYGYDMDYPINLGFENEKYSPKNVEYFFNAISGPNGEKISYEKIDTCCPFPTKKSAVGAGTLDIYQISFEGTEKKIILYFHQISLMLLFPGGLKASDWIPQ